MLLSASCYPRVKVKKGRGGWSMAAATCGRQAPAQEAASTPPTTFLCAPACLLAVPSPPCRTLGAPFPQGTSNSLRRLASRHTARPPGRPAGCQATQAPSRQCTWRARQHLPPSPPPPPQPFPAAPKASAAPAAPHVRNLPDAGLHTRTSGGPPPPQRPAGGQAGRGRVAAGQCADAGVSSAVCACPSHAAPAQARSTAPPLSAYTTRAATNQATLPCHVGPLLHGPALASHRPLPLRS